MKQQKYSRTSSSGEKEPVDDEKKATLDAQGPESPSEPAFAERVGPTDKKSQSTGADKAPGESVHEAQSAGTDKAPGESEREAQGSLENASADSSPVESGGGAAASDEKVKKNKALLFFLRIIQGALVGLGAVLPGISGGVLCVVFGIYRPIMEVLSNPIKKIKEHIFLLIPVALGVIVGFLGVARLLSFLLERYPSQSVCLFVGLIAGMMPSLLREAGEKGRSRASAVSMVCAAAIVLAVLLALQVSSVNITPNFGWYIFCGFCLALSVIAPGMSFSTLLMPLGLYTAFVDGIGRLDFGILIPAGIGALVTVVLLSKAVNYLFEKHYSVAFHAIVGIVISATAVIIPFSSFTEGAVVCIVNLVMLAVGVVAALLLDKFNTKVMSRQQQDA